MAVPEDGEARFRNLYKRWTDENRALLPGEVRRAPGDTVPCMSTLASHVQQLNDAQHVYMVAMQAVEVASAKRREAVRDALKAGLTVEEIAVAMSINEGEARRLVQLG